MQRMTRRWFEVSRCNPVLSTRLSIISLADHFRQPLFTVELFAIELPSNSFDELFMNSSSLSYSRLHSILLYSPMNSICFNLLRAQRSAESHAFWVAFPLSFSTTFDTHHLLERFATFAVYLRRLPSPFTFNVYSHRLISHTVSIGGHRISLPRPLKLSPESDRNSIQLHSLVPTGI